MSCLLTGPITKKIYGQLVTRMMAPTLRHRHVQSRLEHSARKRAQRPSLESVCGGFGGLPGGERGTQTGGANELPSPPKDARNGRCLCPSRSLSSQRRRLSPPVRVVFDLFTALNCVSGTGSSHPKSTGFRRRVEPKLGPPMGGRRHVGGLYRRRRAMRRHARAGGTDHLAADLQALCVLSYHDLQQSVCRQNLLDKLEMELREDLVHLR